jgi:hypothetical protein
MHTGQKSKQEPIGSCEDADKSLVSITEYILNMRTITYIHATTPPHPLFFKAKRQNVISIISTKFIGYRQVFSRR